MRNLFKTMVATAVLLAAGIILLAGCEKEKKVFKDITELLPCVPSSDIIRSCQDTVLLINDRKHLETLCEDAPFVNFSRQSLLIVKGVSTSGIVAIKTDFADNGDASYGINIHVVQNFTCVVQNWYTCYLVPKVNSLDRIAVTIKYTN